MQPDLADGALPRPRSRDDPQRRPRLRRQHHDPLTTCRTHRRAAVSAGDPCQLGAFDRGHRAADRDGYRRRVHSRSAVDPLAICPRAPRRPSTQHQGVRLQLSTASSMTLRWCGWPLWKLTSRPRRFGRRIASSLDCQSVASGRRSGMMASIGDGRCREGFGTP